MPNNTNDANIANSNRGDIRMKRACEARIADPSLTLLEALKIGGFVFPQDQPTCEDCDVDGVRLRQRKNQLSVSEAYVSYGEAPQRDYRMAFVGRFVFRTYMYYLVSFAFLGPRYRIFAD